MVSLKSESEPFRNKMSFWNPPVDHSPATRSFCPYCGNPLPCRSQCEIHAQQRDQWSPDYYKYPYFGSPYSPQRPVQQRCASLTVSASWCQDASSGGVACLVTDQTDSSIGNWIQRLTMEGPVAWWHALYRQRQRQNDPLHPSSNVWHVSCGRNLTTQVVWHLDGKKIGNAHGGAESSTGGDGTIVTCRLGLKGLDQTAMALWNPSNDIRDYAFSVDPEGQSHNVQLVVVQWDASWTEIRDGSPMQENKVLHLPLPAAYASEDVAIPLANKRARVDKAIVREPATSAPVEWHSPQAEMPSGNSATTLNATTLNISRSQSASLPEDEELSRITAASLCKTTVSARTTYTAGMGARTGVVGESEMMETKECEIHSGDNGNIVAEKDASTSSSDNSSSTSSDSESSDSEKVEVEAPQEPMPTVTTGDLETAHHSEMKPVEKGYAGAKRDMASTFLMKDKKASDIEKACHSTSSGSVLKHDAISRDDDSSSSDSSSDSSTSSSEEESDVKKGGLGDNTGTATRKSSSTIQKESDLGSPLGHSSDRPGNGSSSQGLVMSDLAFRKGNTTINKAPEAHPESEIKEKESVGKEKADSSTASSSATPVAQKTAKRKESFAVGAGGSGATGPDSDSSDDSSSSSDDSSSSSSGSSSSSASDSSTSSSSDSDAPSPAPPVASTIKSTPTQVQTSGRRRRTPLLDPGRKIVIDASRMSL